MNKILVLLLVLSTFYASAQTSDLNSHNIYSNALKSFDLDSLCGDEVIITFIGKTNKSYLLKGTEVSKSLKKWIHKPGMDYLFTHNNGYVIDISQVKSEKVYTKFLTIFLSYETGKIVVIEIEDNKE